MDAWLNCDIDASDYYPDPENAGNDRAIKTKLSQLVTPPPANVFVFLDENKESIDDGLFTVGNRTYNVPDVWYKLPSARHSQGCNVSFADGRVEHWTWRWPKSFVGHGQPVALDSADPQRFDVEDLRRLQACVPLP
jgi:prepilin-type processing-associated H-X9-DG protein